MENRRLARLRTLMDERDLEALFVTNPVNRRYLSGFTGSAGYLVITPNDAILFTDFRYRDQAPQEVQDFQVIEHPAEAVKYIGGKLRDMGVKRIGFEDQDVSYADYEKLSAQFAMPLVPAGRLIEQLRMVKDDQELQVIQEAATLADRTYEHILGIMRPGMKELDIALELEFYMRANGAHSHSFDTIVASGIRSSMPHGTASDKVLEEGDFVTLDFGALLGGYCSDITRTVVLGSATDRHREIYEIVLEAQLKALREIKPGMTGAEADAVARSYIAEHGFGEYFGHSLGHGLGMEVHEEPRLSRTSDVILQPGMVVTIEPGIYIPEFGGVRIEDDVVVTNTGVRRLTTSTKELMQLT